MWIYWLLPIALGVMLLIAVDEANGLRSRLVDEQLAHGSTLASLRRIQAEEVARRMSGPARPARLSCAVYRDRANGRPIVIYRN